MDYYIEDNGNQSPGRAYLEKVLPHMPGDVRGVHRFVFLADSGGRMTTFFRVSHGPEPFHGNWLDEQAWNHILTPYHRIQDVRAKSDVDHEAIWAAAGVDPVDFRGAARERQKEE